jgi:uncharacterized membrane protein (DUF485 family)
MVTGSGPSPRRDTDSRHRGRCAAIAQDEKFVLLRRKFTKRATLVLSAVFGWYFLYVFAAVFARDIMSRRLVGRVNVALVLGVLQFAVTFIVTARYTRYSREVMDPLAAQIVADAEDRVGSGGRPRTEDAR